MTLTEFLSFINKVKNKIDKNKLSRSGKFYIGTLIINIETITPSTDIGLSISWPNTPVNLNHVIIEYDKDFIKATYEDKYAMFYPHQKMWYVTKDKLIKQHKEFFNREVQEEIRPRSRLSESDNLKWVPPLR